jgi:hypothetical protein
MRKTFGYLALCLTVSAYGRTLRRQIPSARRSPPHPNTYRTASGAPGAAYWQQRADYTIRATLDESKRAISGSEQIRYHNNSPDTLHYLWVQLDQNIYKKDSDARMMLTQPSREAWPSRRRRMTATSSKACAASWPAVISTAASRSRTSGGRQAAQVRHQPHHDAHRPANAAEAGPEVRLQYRLVLQHQRAEGAGRPLGLRAL